MKLVLILCSLLFAQAVNVDLTKLSSQSRNEILDQQAKAAVVSPDRVKDWALVGEGIAKALSSACKELSIGVNDFVKTPVGKLTTLIIVWKMIGKDFLGLFIWIAITVISIFVFRFLFGNVKNNDKFERRCKVHPDGVVGLSVVAVVMWVIPTICLLVAIFNN